MVRRNSARSWAMFSVLMLCSIAVGLSQMKITPVMSDLADVLGVTTTDVAWLTSVFTLAGIVLSIPGALVIGRFGPKRTLLFTLAMLAGGNVLGACAVSTQAGFALVLASRVIEGVATVFALPVGIDLIGRWFEGPSVGTATGIYMTATPIATFAMTASGLSVAHALGGVVALWWIVAALAVGGFAMALLLIDERADAQDAPSLAAVGTPVAPSSAGLLNDVAGALRSRPLVLLCSAMFFLAFLLYALITCYPQVFSFYGLPSETSNLLTSLNGLIGIPMSVVAGVVIGKTGRPHDVALVGALGALATCATLPLLSDATYALNVVCSAVFPGGIAMAPMFVLAPLLVGRADLAPMGTCLMNTCFYLGQFVSTPLVTALSDGNTTWTVPAMVLSAACVAMLVLVVASKRALASEA